MMLALRDDRLPGLTLLQDKRALVSALGNAMSNSHPHLGTPVDFRIVRARHRPGLRAIVQGELALERNNSAFNYPVSLWFFAGSKAGKKAQAERASGVNGGPVFEPKSGLLMYVFPDDPHVPAVGRFLSDPSRYLPTLAPHVAEVSEPPQLARYRPGVGTTLRWKTRGQDAVYVKIQTETSVAGTAATLAEIDQAARGAAFAVPQLSGIDLSLNAIALHEVAGTAYGSILADESSAAIEQSTDRILEALTAFHGINVRPRKRKERNDLVERSAETAGLITSLQPAAAPAASDLAHWLKATPVHLFERPIHADMKVEHLVMAVEQVVLLDLDSFALGDPLYDLAMLDMRIAMHGEAGHCGTDAALMACRQVQMAAARDGSPGTLYRYGWLKACTALQLARHHAQNLSAESPRLIHAALALGDSARMLCGTIDGSVARSRQGQSRRDNNTIKENLPCA
jgi:Phosphotransferase enzyme family